MAQEKTKASWADEIDELDQNESSPVTYEKEFTQKTEEDDRIDSEDRPRRERRERNNRDREPREPREQREPLPFPDSPPFTAFVGNLPYNIYRDEIQKFFEERGCKVQNVRLLMNKDTNKPKGFGYVIFEELEDLKKAVGLSGQELLERPLRIDVAEARAEDLNKPRSRDNNRGGFTRVGGNNNRSYNNNRSTPENSRRDDKERPRIEILPRSANSSEEVGGTEAYKAASKENPFGNAKPRDENVALKSIQERRSKEDISPISPTSSNEEDRSRVRRDNNNSGRGGRSGNNRSNNSSSGGRRYDDKKNNKDSRSNDKSSRPPRAPREDFKSEPKTQISKNPFEGLAEEDD